MTRCRNWGGKQEKIPVGRGFVIASRSQPQRTSHSLRAGDEGEREEEEAWDLEFVRW